MVDCVIPQLFHGTRGDVIVEESSIERLISFPSKPSFSYMSLNMLDVSMMDRYWSATTPFITMPVPTVDATRDTLFLVNGIIRLASWCSMPLAFMLLPKHIEHMTR